MLTPRAQRILVRAAEIISDPKHWITGSFQKLNLITQEDRYCALGAIYRAGMEENGETDPDKFRTHLHGFVFGADHDVTDGRESP